MCSSETRSRSECSYVTEGCFRDVCDGATFARADCEDNERKRLLQHTAMCSCTTRRSGRQITMNWRERFQGAAVRKVKTNAQLKSHQSAELCTGPALLTREAIALAPCRELLPPPGLSQHPKVQFNPIHTLTQCFIKSHIRAVLEGTRSPSG